MVKRILNFLHAESGGLQQAAFVLAATSILSSVLGLFRDRLLAGTFGAGQTLDIYYAAFKIPDFLFIVSLFLASNASLIPFFLGKTHESHQKGREFLNNIFTIFTLSLLAVIAIVFFCVPFLAKIVAPGFNGESLRQFILITRIMLLSPLLLGLSNVFSIVVQSFNRFLIYSLSPILYNVGIIFGIVFLAPRYGLVGLVLGIVIGALLHFAVQLPSMAKLDFLPVIVKKIDWREGWKIVKMSFPRTLGSSLNQIVLIYITATASYLAVGSITVFNFAFNIQSVALSAIGLSYSVAAFPVLSKLFIKGQKEEFLERALSTARQIFFWTVPPSIFIIVLRAQIVRALLGTGAFDWNDTMLTTAALAAFAFSIVAQSLVALFARIFYAAGKTAKPLFINAIFSVLIIVFVSVFLKAMAVAPAFRIFIGTVFRVDGLTGLEVIVLPLVFSLGMTLNAVFLILAFQKEFGVVWPKFKNTFYQVVSASLLAGVVVYIFLNLLDKVFNTKTFFGIFFQGSLSAIAGIIVWYCCLQWFENEELKDVIKILKQKFWKVSVPAPEPKDMELP